MERWVQFDFEIEFSHGGGLQGQDFRLDIDAEDISDGDLADRMVNDMQWLMVGKINIFNKKIIEEKHKRRKMPAKEPAHYLIDLSHTIENGLVTYKGLPAPVICDYLSRESSKDFYEADTSFQIGRIEMVTNTGTYLDCPFHRYENGRDLSQIELDRFADLEAICISIPFNEQLQISKKYFETAELNNRAVLVHTGWARHWNTENYYENHPFLTEDAAIFLRDAGVKLVGIDSHNIDDTRGRARPVHSLLLGAEILIVEHLCNLELLPKTEFSFSAVPPKFKGVGTFPVRAMARLTR